VIIGLSVVLLVSAAYAILRVKFEGEDLADTIAGVLNKRMRGRIAIGSVDWSPSALKTVITGGWVPVTIHDVKVWDDCALSAADINPDQLRTGDPNEECTPDDRADSTPGSTKKPRKVLIRVPLITAEIDIHALMFGRHDFVFRHLVIHGGEGLLEETVEPYPLHAYDRVVLSIVTAFYPRMKAGFRMGIYADSPPPLFDLRDIHVRDLNLTVHMKPYPVAATASVGYQFTARLEGVNLDPDGLTAATSAESDAKHSYLYMDATDPLIAKFYVRLAVDAAKGQIRIRDEGLRTAFRLPTEAPLVREGLGIVWPPEGRHADYTIDLTDVKLNRLAQMPGEWPRRNNIANTLELDLQAKTLPCGPGKNAKDSALLHLRGELHDYWDRPYDGQWNLSLDTENLGPTVRTCIKSNVGGESLSGTISLTGPFVASPRIGLDMKNLDVDVGLRAGEPPLPLTLAEVHGAIDLVNEQGFIDKTVALIKGGTEPGEVALSATFALKPLNANAQIEIAKAIDVGRFLPTQIATKVGKYLKGRLRARGDVEEGFALEDFDLALGATADASVLRVHKGRLFTDDDFDTIHVEKVFVNLRQSHAEFDGKVDIKKQDLDLRVEGYFPDLGYWMGVFGLPQYVKSAGGGTVIILKGPLNQPRINVSTDLEGVPCVDTLRLVDTQISNGVVEIRKMTTAGLGGKLTGSGRIRLGSGAPYIEQLELQGQNIEAAKLCGLAGKLKGTLSNVDLEIARTTVDKRRSALDWIDYAKVFAKAPKLTIYGDAYSDVSLCLNQTDAKDKSCRPEARSRYVTDVDLKACADAKKGGGACVVATANRDGGGIVDATLAKLPPLGKSKQPRLGGALSVDLPLAILDQFIKPFQGRPLVGGAVQTTLHLGGSPTAPTADGHLTLLRTWIAKAFVGDSQLRVEPTTLANGKPGVSITGTAMAGRLGIKGTLGTQAPYPVELAVTMRRLEADTAVDLTAILGAPEPVQAWVSGTVTAKLELDPASKVAPEAWVELSEVEGIVNHRGADGRVVPLRMSVIDQAPGARAAVSMRVTQSSLELACRNPAAPGGVEPCSTKIATPAGVIEVSGHATPTSIALQAGGMLDLALVAPLFDTRFDEATGSVRLTASVSGTLLSPSYEAALELDPFGLWATNPKKANPVRLRPVGGDTVLEAPTGLIKLANGSIGFTDVLLQVRDEHVDEAGELHVKGNIVLDGITPTKWAMLISGRLAGKMLLVAVPGIVSQAGGLVSIDGDLILSGNGKRPQVSGTVTFDPPEADPTLRSLSLIPRGVHRELQMKHGTIDIESSDSADLRRTYKLTFDGIKASINGEGSLDNINGEVEIKDGELAQLNLSLDADSVPFKIQDVLNVTLAANNIRIQKSQFSNLSVSGNIAVVEGTYLRDDLNLTGRIGNIGYATQPTRPFWEEYPTIGSAQLALNVEVRRFAVATAIAKVDLVGPLLEISGTPREPHMAGSIRIDRGEFRITGTRAKFTQTSGSVDFAENRSIGNPELNITSVAPDFRDLGGQEHTITLTINGPLSNLQWDLRTSTGYNKSQTLTLVLLGRNQEQLRRSLGDQAVGTNPQAIDPTTNPSQGFTDQILKDLAGDYVTAQLGDQLTKLTNLDVFRLVLSFDTIGVHIEKKVFENLNIINDNEQTIRGSTINAKVQLKTPYRVNLEGNFLSKRFSDPAEQDILDYGGKLVYPWFWE
jgi:hypothetical protein